MPGNQKILFHSILCAMIVHGDELISLNTILTVFLCILIQASFSQWGSGHVADSAVIMILPFVFFFKSAAVTARVVLFPGPPSCASSIHSIIWKHRTFGRKTFRGISFLVYPDSSIEPIRCSVVGGHHEITVEVITQEFKLLSATKFHTNVFKDFFFFKKKKVKWWNLRSKMAKVNLTVTSYVLGEKKPQNPNAFLFITHQPEQFVTSGDTNPLCCQVDRACEASAFYISCLSVLPHERLRTKAAVPKLITKDP